MREEGGCCVKDWSDDFACVLASLEARSIELWGGVEGYFWIFDCCGPNFPALLSKERSRSCDGCCCCIGSYLLAFFQDARGFGNGSSSKTLRFLGYEWSHLGFAVGRSVLGVS